MTSMQTYPAFLIFQTSPTSTSLRVALLFELRFDVFATHGAVLHEFSGMFLPCGAGFILLVETDGADAVPRFGAGDDEDGALSSWHNGQRVLMVLSDCKGETTGITDFGPRTSAMNRAAERSTEFLCPKSSPQHPHPCRKLNTPETATAPSPAAVTNWAKWLLPPETSPAAKAPGTVV